MAMVAAVPSSRWSPGGTNAIFFSLCSRVKSSTQPIKDLRELPRRIGLPSTLSSSRRCTTSRFCSCVLPKPMPGSTIIFPQGTPALSACLMALFRSEITAGMISWQGESRWLLIKTIGTPFSAARSASAGSFCSPQMSFIILAPAFRVCRATSTLYVSILTGTDTSLASFSTTGTTRRSSSSTETGVEPGRVDSPPMSMMSAPSGANRFPLAMACSASPIPSPEKESGETFTTPMM